jgi:hypothetical protein
LFEKAFVFKAQQKRQTVRLTTGDLPSWGIEQALSVGEVWNRLELCLPPRPNRAGCAPSTLLEQAI